MTTNPLDALASCADPASYPTKVFRTQLFPHTLRLYHQRMDERETQVFGKNAKRHKIEFWDCYDGQDEFQSSPCNTVERLREHLHFRRKDPKCRHVFIEASHSRAPLDCSREMLGFVFGFHQVMVQFLDIVLCFVPRRGVPVAFHHSAFRYEHFLDLAEAKIYGIPELGRSGLEIRHCYNLWSVEKSDSKHSSPWAIRQTAVFHSFDMENGRTLWINIKANNLMEKRIKEATDAVACLRATLSKDLQRSFAATLITHLIVFEWCDESWRHYIASLEADFEAIQTKAKGIPLDKIEKELFELKTKIDDSVEPLSPASTFHTPSRGNSWDLVQNWKRNINSSLARSGTGLTCTTIEENSPLATQSPTMASPVSPSSPETRGNKNDVPKPRRDMFSALHEFRFKELQNLHYIGTQLQEASMVMHLNIQILNDVMKYYEILATDAGTPEAIRTGCKAALSSFMQRTSAIVRNLEIERTRIATLMEILENAKTLVDAIIQFRNMEINQSFTINAHKSSVRMEEVNKDMHRIAEKTEKETASMHVITLVTLVFLPGTFVATFLGSGTFQWGDGGGDEDEIRNFPFFRPLYFALFAAISVPLMVATFLIWYFRREIPRFPWSKCRFWRKAKTLDEESGLPLVEPKECLKK